MIAKGELVLAPVQQQDLAFLMQSGTQEWRGEYQAAQMTSLMQLEQELAQGKPVSYTHLTLPTICSV